jgi:hypothetical protein
MFLQWLCIGDGTIPLRTRGHWAIQFGTIFRIGWGVNPNEGRQVKGPTTHSSAVTVTNSIRIDDQRWETIDKITDKFSENFEIIAVEPYAFLFFRLTKIGRYLERSG